MDPLNKMMLDAIQKALLEKSGKIHRKIKFVQSSNMPISGMTGVPIDAMLSIYYEMEMRDMALVSLIEMMEDLFSGLENSPFGAHFLEGLAAGKEAVQKNVFLLTVKDAINHAEGKITEECPGWDE